MCSNQFNKSLCIFLSLCVTSVVALGNNCEVLKNHDRKGNPHSDNHALKVFVLAGQSNMVGSRSNPELLPDGMKRPNTNILFFDGDDWVTMVPGVTERQGFGPEFTFAKVMQQALGEPIGIIKHSHGGTNLANHWHPARKPRQSRFYRQLLDKVSNASALRDIQILGMCWMQGESDAAEVEYAEAYSNNLEMLVRELRLEFNNSEMVFVCGRINSPLERFPVTNTVRKAQSQLDMPGYMMVDLDDLTMVSDNLHFDTEGIMEMGRRFALATKVLLQKSIDSSYKK